MENMRINTLNNFFKNNFGEKIYKVSLDGGFTCPNRDGTLSSDGCIFCSDKGSGEFCSDKHKTIHSQIDEQLELICAKFPKGMVIAYFQNFTNTYGDINYLKKIYNEALSHPRVIGLAIATRPDCLQKEIIDLLVDLNKKTFLWVELGLQTANDRVGKFINRGYDKVLYEEITKKLYDNNIKFVTHIIVGLPKEEKNDALKTAIFAEKCNTWGIKIHLLHVIKNTVLEKLYLENKLKVYTKDEYVNSVISILENIDSQIVVHRITGDGEKASLVAPLWSLDKRSVLNSIQKTLKFKNSFQGYFKSNPRL